MFRFTILWRHVRTRHPELCVVQQEKYSGRRIVKLTSVVALDSFDSPAELSRHISNEIRQSSEDVRFKFQGKCTLIMSKIIKNNQIVLTSNPTH
jgi:hypothetical protein